MKAVNHIQEWLRRAGIAGLVIPSTDEFLSEFAPPANRRLEWATGFRGSTGTAVVLQDSAALFVDGRYFLQGASDTAGSGITVVPATLSARRAWLQQSLTPRSRLALDPWMHSTADVAQWRSLAAEVGLELQALTVNPIDRLWSQGRPVELGPRIVDYPIRYAGEAYQAKCAALVEHVEAAGLEALLVADPEDVSWLLNVRAGAEALRTAVGQWHVVPSCASRVLIERDGKISWFVHSDRLAPEVQARGTDTAGVVPPERLPDLLREVSRRGTVGVDLRRTPAALTAIIEEHGRICADDTVSRRRWRKHSAELQSARHVHIVDSVAVVRLMAWLVRTVPQRIVTEWEAAEVLEAFRMEHPEYKGPSMPQMSAAGPSGSQPHYVPRREANRRLNDHPIFWMDSGGQYFGGTTDNTVTLAVGSPEARHLVAHTTVLRGYIALASSRVPSGVHGLALDTIARQPLWREGMDFGHGTGHGVGNYLSIHEGPFIGREPGPNNTIPVEPGMILSNEPGYYVAGDFGIRIESHLVTVPSRHPNFIEFETISRLPIDATLVDFARLSSFERQWLADYHRLVWQDLQPRLDEQAAGWLRGKVDAFIQAEG